MHLEFFSDAKKIPLHNVTKQIFFLAPRFVFLAKVFFFIIFLYFLLQSEKCFCCKKKCGKEKKLFCH